MKYHELILKYRNKLLNEILDYSFVNKFCLELTKIGAKVINIGFSNRKNRILCIKVGRGNLRVAYVCRLHGNEPAPTNACLLFLLDLLADSLREYGIWLNDIIDKVSIYAIPVSNPDGASLYYELSSKVNHRPSWEHIFSKARFNSMGYDLNTDWHYLKQPETKCIHKLITKVDPHIIIDSHEFYYKGNHPPLWPEEFMITLTDTPYKGVHSSIKELSNELMKEIILFLKREGYSSWKIKERHFIGRGVREYDEIIAKPFALGSHFPYEGSAKVLVETWGIGLGEYLLSDRVIIHYLSMIKTLEFMIKEFKKVIACKNNFLKNELSYSKREYIVEGNDVVKVHEVLKLHGVEVKWSNNDLIVEVPQRRSTMASLLLDREFELNKLIKEKFGNYVTLDKVYEVKIKSKEEI